MAPHIDEVASTVSKSIGIICRLKHIVPPEVLKTLYSSLILPYFSYCNIVWGNTSRTNLDKLIVLQKKIVRILTNSPFRTHSQPILQNLKYLSVINLNKYQQGLFMYKYYRKLLPYSYMHMFTPNLNAHSYGTRASSDLQYKTTHHRTSAFQKNIKYTGPKLWNTCHYLSKNRTPTISSKVN